MEKFNVRDAKLISVIVLIIVIFAIVVGNAFKYLPEQASEIPEINTEKTLPADNEEDIANEEENTTEPAAEEEKPVKKNLYKSEEVEEEVNVTPSNITLTPLENISETEQGSSSVIPAQAEAETFDSVIKKAGELKEDKQFVKSISEYQKAVTLADSSKKKAQCYEEIAYIYAITKRYGTSFSYAQKAYNLYPTSSGEVLLARLYYKTGNIDKATERINNVLKRDFTRDN